MKKVEKTEGSIIRGRTKTEIVPEVVECVTCEASIEKDGYDSKVAGEKQLGTKLAVTWKWNIESWTCRGFVFIIIGAILGTIGYKSGKRAV